MFAKNVIEPDNSGRLSGMYIRAIWIGPPGQKCYLVGRVESRMVPAIVVMDSYGRFFRVGANPVRDPVRRELGRLRGRKQEIKSTGHA